MEMLHGVDVKFQRTPHIVMAHIMNYKIKDQVYIISSDDYKIIQVKKKLQEWIK